MRLKRTLCTMLALMAVMTVGCGGGKTDGDNVVVYDSDHPAPQATTEHYEEVKTFYGESASYGDMTVTVTKVEDPEIPMSNGKMAVFFEVTIENGTEDVVPTNYLNNFTVTVDGTYYEASECFTIPVMKKLYDFYGDEAFADEIPAGSSFTGYLAAEVDEDFESLQLHYIPKTTDRGSRVTVDLTRDNMTAPEK